MFSSDHRRGQKAQNVKMERREVSRGDQVELYYPSTGPWGKVEQTSTVHCGQKLAVRKNTHSSLNKSLIVFFITVFNDLYQKPFTFNCFKVLLTQTSFTGRILPGSNIPLFPELPPMSGDYPRQPGISSMSGTREVDCPTRNL